MRLRYLRAKPLFAGIVLAAAMLASRAHAAEPPASTSAADFPGVVWKNRIAEEDLWTKSNWSREDGTLSITRDQAFTAFPEKMQDAAMRVRFRYDGPKGSFIDLILRSDGNATKVRYVATTFIGKQDDHPVSMVIRFQGQEGKLGTLGGKGGLATLKPGDEHTVEFYAQGDHLAYYFDGRLVVSYHDSTLSEGQACLFTGSQVHFLSVETAELPKAPVLAAAPVVPPPVTPAAAPSRVSPTPQPLTPLPPPVTAMLATPRPATPGALPPGFTTSTGNSTPSARPPGGSPTPTADDLRNLPTIDTYQLAKDSGVYEGRVVKLKFTARVFELTHDDNKTSHGFVGVRVGRTWYNTAVSFPSERDEWFTKFSNTPSGPYVVYARMGTGSSGRTATILGRKVENGASGPEIVW